jgi:hypothetical protein
MSEGMGYFDGLYKERKRNHEHEHCKRGIAELYICTK